MTCRKCPTILVSPILLIIGHRFFRLAFFVYAPPFGGFECGAIARTVDDYVLDYYEREVLSTTMETGQFCHEVSLPGRSANTSTNSFYETYR